MNFFRLSLAGMALAGLVTGAANAAPVEYVRVCDIYGTGFFYVPGTEICVRAENGDERKETEYGTLRYVNRLDLALQGTAMAMAMPNPYIEHGKNFAIAGNFAYYAGASAAAVAAAMRVTPNISFTGSFAYGINQNTAAARFGLTWSDAAAAGNGSTLGLSEPSRPDFKRAFVGNVSLFGGFWRHDYQQGEDDDDATHGFVLGALARARFAAGAVDAWQFDAWTDFGQVSESNGAPGTQQYSRSTIGAAVHFTHAFTPDNRFGVLGSYGYLAGGQRGFINVGLEGIRAIQDVVVVWQGGYVFGIRNYREAAFYGHASLRYFLNPDLMVETNGGVSYFNPDGEIDSFLYRFALRAERRLANRNIAVFAEYAGNYLDRSYDLSPGWSMENSVLGGVRFLMGEGTLKNSAINGAGLVDYNPISGQYRHREF